MKLLLSLFLSFMIWNSSLASLPKSIEQGRMKEISAMLSNHPQGLGLTYKDRKFWNSIAKDSKLVALMNEVPELAKKGIPAFIDSLYLDLSKTGKRPAGEKMLNERYDYLSKLVIAECFENKNNYTQAIENAIVSLCDQKAWTLPAHDKNLKTFNGQETFVDLVSATFGNSLAQSLYMLDDKLSSKVKQKAMSALEQKVLTPVRNCIKSEKLFTWFTETHNWNSVCLNGVVGIATATLTSKDDRAFFIALAEQYHTYGLDGYSDDGYCSEGVTYFNYGFGALVNLREMVCRATNGQIDFFDTPKFFKIAQYANKIEIMNKVCPAYSDCLVEGSPSGFIRSYCSNALALESYREQNSFPDWANFSMKLIGFFPKQTWILKSTKNKVEDKTYRSYFDISGIYVGRPGSTEHKLGVSAKGGHNAENHNHNDVGSYAVALGKELISGDQGRPLSYPSEYWASNSYDKYKIKGSFGHPVPFVNKKTQIAGKNAHGEVVSTSFTEVKDEFVIELKSAYVDSTLKKMERSFLYNREGTSSFTVSDHFEFSNPGSFETAITTRAKWNRLSTNKFELIKGGERVLVIIDSSAPFEMNTTKINDNAPEYSRIGIRLVDKQMKGFISIKYCLE